MLYHGYKNHEAVSLFVVGGSQIFSAFGIYLHYQFCFLPLANCSHKCGSLAKMTRYFLLPCSTKKSQLFSLRRWGRIKSSTWFLLQLLLFLLSPAWSSPLGPAGSGVAGAHCFANFCVFLSPKSVTSGLSNINLWKIILRLLINSIKKVRLLEDIKLLQGTVQIRQQTLLLLQ